MDLSALFVALLSPMVLAFMLGIIATRLQSDLKFPEPIYVLLTIYLLVAIGLKGGYKLSITKFSDFGLPALAAILISSLIPLWVYLILRKLGKFEVPNAAAIAAHYGSVSAVTFSEAISFMDNLKADYLVQNAGLTEVQLTALGATYEGFMPGLLAIMEVPAIMIAIFIARFSMRDTNPISGTDRASLSHVMRELLAGKSSLLLLGFLVIGYAVGKRGYDQVAPLFDAPFRGFLTLFLLEAGLVTGRRLGDLNKVGKFLIGFGIVMPFLHAILGIWLGQMAGLSCGGATILGVLAASASYIAAPAAVRVAIPEASPTYYLTASLAITFPFNILIGLPAYHFIAKAFYGLL